MNVIYFGNDLFSPCLEHLLQNNVNVLKIYTYPQDNLFDFNVKVREIARKYNIPITEEKITAEELKFQFEQNDCDLAFSLCYLYRIPVEAVPSFKGINFHPTILPQGRGPWPMPHIILKELKTSGVTAHKLAPKLDEGEILLCKRFAVSEKEDYNSLVEKIRITALDVMRELVCDLEYYWNNAKAQIGGEWWDSPTDEMRTIYSDTPESEKDKIIRAFGKDYVIFKGEEK